MCTVDPSVGLKEEDIDSALGIFSSDLFYELKSDLNSFDWFIVQKLD